jgi:hypothetical protein
MPPPGDPRDPEHRPDPAELARLERVAKASEDLPPELTVAFGEAVAALYVNLTDRGVEVEAILGMLHSLVTTCMAPVLVGQAQAAGEHQHRWGAGLGSDFVLGSIEEHAGGKLFQTCPDCGARRQVT